jgi:hypothetical protein
VAPYFTPQRGDIPAKGWRIHPRAKPVAFCYRGKLGEKTFSLYVEVILDFWVNHFHFGLLLMIIKTSYYFTSIAMK